MIGAEEIKKRHYQTCKQILGEKQPVTMPQVSEAVEILLKNDVGFPSLARMINLQREGTLKHEPHRPHQFHPKVENSIRTFLFVESGWKLHQKDKKDNIHAPGGT